MPRAAIGQLGPTVTDLMAACGIVQSKSAARRAVEEGGAYLNNVKVTDIDAAPEETDLLHGRFLLLRQGKRKVGGIELHLADSLSREAKTPVMRGSCVHLHVHGRHES